DRRVARGSERVEDGLQVLALVDDLLDPGFARESLDDRRRLLGVVEAHPERLRQELRVHKTRRLVTELLQIVRVRLLVILELPRLDQASQGLRLELLFDERLLVGGRLGERASTRVHKISAQVDRYLGAVEPVALHLP